MGVFQTKFVFNIGSKFETVKLRRSSRISLRLEQTINEATRARLKDRRVAAAPIYAYLASRARPPRKED